MSHSASVSNVSAIENIEVQRDTVLAGESEHQTTMWPKGLIQGSMICPWANEDKCSVLHGDDHTVGTNV